ncbi:hypothetical protein M8J77_004438 [Diaphorina citri]|nr:hypothetical protein M8J77_004438 [Diaphorina citri]
MLVTIPSVRHMLDADWLRLGTCGNTGSDSWQPGRFYTFYIGVRRRSGVRRETAASPFSLTLLVCSVRNAGGLNLAQLFAKCLFGK